MNSDSDTTVCEPALVEKPEHNYALYAYHAVSDIAVVNGLSNDSLDLVGEEEEEKDAKNFTLSILSTDLTASEEMELRSHLNKKVMKGVTDSLVTSVSLQATEEEAVVQPNCHGCYHRLFLNEENESRGYVVSFLLKQEKGFELFQQDLDKYSQELDLKMDAQFTNLETSVKTYLASWYQEVILYVSRCLKLMSKDIEYLIHASLMDMKLEMDNANDRQQIDLNRFMNSCGLKEILTSTGDQSNLVNTTENREETGVLKIDLSDQQSPKLSGVKSTLLCKEWAETLIQASSSSPFCQRQIIESYKLKIIQDMNQLRRFMKQSETDHYALFRTYAFLKTSGNVPVMLYLAKGQALGANTRQVIDVLDSYMVNANDVGLACA